MITTLASRLIAIAAVRALPTTVRVALTERAAVAVVAVALAAVGRDFATVDEQEEGHGDKVAGLRAAVTKSRLSTRRN
jgi:hypothetical protein